MVKLDHMSVWRQMSSKDKVPRKKVHGVVRQQMLVFVLRPKADMIWQESQECLSLERCPVQIDRDGLKPLVWKIIDLAQKCHFHSTTKDRSLLGRAYNLILDRWEAYRWQDGRGEALSLNEKNHIPGTECPVSAPALQKILEIRPIPLCTHYTY